MLANLKKEVYDANMLLPDKYLVPMQKDLLDRHFSNMYGKTANQSQNDNESLV